MSDGFSDTLRELTDLLRTGLVTRAALARWPERCTADAAPGPAAVAARLALGERPEDAVRVLGDHGFEDASALSSILRLQRVTGCDPANLVEALAVDVEGRARLSHSARQSTAGPKLSGRLIAGLPIAFLPLVFGGGGWALDRRGALVLVTGAGLLMAGISWIARLLPRAPVPDEAARLAELLAAAVRAGVRVGDGLLLCRECAPAGLAPELDRAARRARLGGSWARALASADDAGLRALGAIVAREAELGAAIGPALVDFATGRRGLQDSNFDGAVRRAPVLMVLPLVLCILPAFVLLAIVPFFRALAG